jgi:hypothetical protein
MLGILEQLLAPEGTELCLLPAGTYVTRSSSPEGSSGCASFWELSAMARSRFELLIGWRLAGQDEVILNPEGKADRRVWTNEDNLILIRRTARKKRLQKRPNSFFVQ